MSDTDRVRGRVERTLLGGARRYNRVQVTEAVGVSMERARRLWMAMGFAEVGDEDVVFTDGDVEALRVWDNLVTTGVVTADEEASVARALSQPLSRLADWQTQEVLSRARGLATGAAERIGPDGRTAARLGGSDPDELAALAEGLLPVIETLQSYVWRRHLAAATGRMLSGTGDGIGTSDGVGTSDGGDPSVGTGGAGELSARHCVIGFADIVGYTTTTRHSDARELAALLEAFEKDATETIATHHGRVVKTVGDEVLFVADTAVEAAEIGLRLVRPGRTEDGLPTLRVGLAMGQVLTRFGDVYGSVVNLAARLTALARPGRVLVDAELAAALRDEPEYRLRPRRPTAVRGYHHLRSWSLRRVG